MLSLQVLALVGSAIANAEIERALTREVPNVPADQGYPDPTKGARTLSAANEDRALWGGYDPCVNYDYYGKCTECKDGYILTKFGECKEEIKHCIEYDMIGNCKKCDEGFFEGRGTCHKIIVGCIKYDPWVFNCQKCDEGWFFEFDACHKEIKHCDRYNKKYWYCEHCLWPYESTGFQCVPSQYSSYSGGWGRMLWGFDPCIEYNSFGHCKDCKDGYYLTKFGECKEEIKHCVEYNMIGNCEKCDPGYFVGKGTCHKMIKGWIKYDQDVFNCQKCDEG